jgi:alpha-mannosidase
MNNHWGTNYRAYQEGPVVFRFILRPHLQASPVEAFRLAIGLNHPLVVRKASGTVPKVAPLLYVHSKDVLVTALKPSDDGKAWIVRLFGAAGKTVHTKITWAKPEPRQIWLSDTSEKRRRKANECIEVPTYDLVTLRAEHGLKRGRK